MPDYTPRLNLPKPLGCENNTRANFNALIDAIDSAAETPAGAQAKANAAQQAAKTYTDSVMSSENINVIPYRVASASGDDYPIGVSVFATPVGQGNSMAD